MTNPQEEQLLEVARRLLPLLSTVLNRKDAHALSTTLQGLLERGADGENVEAELRAALGRHGKVKNTRDRYLRAAAAEGGEQFNLVPVPSPPGPIAPIVWVCPHGDVEWPQFHVGEKVPSCKQHKCRLVLKDERS